MLSVSTKLSDLWLDISHICSHKGSRHFKLPGILMLDPYIAKDLLVSNCSTVLSVWVHTASSDDAPKVVLFTSATHPIPIGLHTYTTCYTLSDGQQHIFSQLG